MDCLSAGGRLVGGRQERLPGRAAHGHAGGAASPGHAVHRQHATAGQSAEPDSLLSPGGEY